MNGKESVIHNKDLRIVSELHRMRGTLPGPVRRENGQFSAHPDKTFQKEGGIWENVHTHTEMAFFVADTLAEAFGLPEDERALVGAAAYAHDTNKKTEILWQRAIRENSDNDINGMHLRDEDIYMSEQQAQRVVLQNIGDMEEWENAETGLPPAVSQLMKVNIPRTEKGHETLVEKIMWFTDACLTDDKIVSIQQRFDNLDRGWNEKKQIEDPVRAAENKHFSDFFKEQYNGKSLYDVQRELGKRYVHEFAEELGVKDEEFFDWLREKVKGKIEKQQMPIL